jgi:integrase
VRLAAISGLYDFARRLGAVPSNPAADVRRPRRVSAPAKTLTAEQIERLLAAIPETNSGLRDRAIIVLILLEGLRRSEVLSLRAADVDFAIGDYCVRVKGGHQRRRRIPPPALRAIITSLEAQGRGVERLAPDDLLFDITGSGLYANFRRYAAVAGLENVTPHALRHAAAKLRRRSGASIEAVSAFLGHSSIATTAIYLRQHEVEPDEGWRPVASALDLAVTTQDSVKDVTGARCG